MRNRIKALLGATLLCSLFAFTGQAAAAGTCPNEAIREEQRATSLPECRAYEQVSPAVKVADIGTTNYEKEITVGLAVSPDGDAAAFTSMSAPLGNANGWGVSTLATRGDAGWSPQGLSFVPGPGANGQPIGPGEQFFGFSADRRTAVYRDLTEGPHPRLYLRRSDGSRALIAEGTGPVDNNAAKDPSPKAITLDGRHVIFVSKEELVPFKGDPETAGSLQLYDWTDNGGSGTLQLVNVDNSGALIDPSGGANLGGEYNGLPSFARVYDRNAVSADGRRIYFQSAEAGQVGSQLYLREDGTKTVEVSAPQDGLTAPAERVNFLGANEDGSKVWFAANGRLTAAAPPSESSQASLYQYDVTTRKLTWIVTLPSSLVTFAGLLPDAAGDRIYFGESTFDTSDLESSDDIYTWTGGAPRLVFQHDAPGERIASISPHVSSPVGLRDSVAPSADISQDGRYLVFSIASTASSQSTPSELFRYDAQRDDLVDISAIPGVAPYSYRPSLSADSGSYTRQNLVHVMSRNGQTVFFDTDAPMVPGDTNGVRDVYEWHEGKVSLISSGTGGSDSVFSDLDETAEGANAFFTTRDALVAQDGDEFFDIYDARINGGFATPGAARTCSGDACQGVQGGSPSPTPPASIAFPGRGNPAAPGRTVKVRIVKVRQGRGSSVQLKVRVPARGRIIVSGRAVRRSQARVGRAGVHHVAVRLKKFALRALRRGHRLRVRVIVRFVPVGGRSSTARARVTFRPKYRAHRRHRAHRQRMSRATRRPNVLSSETRKGW